MRRRAYNTFLIYSIVKTYMTTIQQTMPRIAILLLGNMRSYNITFKNLEAHLLKHYNCDIYITTYDKRFNSKWGGGNPEEHITEQQIRSVYGNYVRSVTIIKQDDFTESYMRMNEKVYMFGNELDRLFTIQKLGMVALDIFRGECSRNNKHYDIILRMRPDILLNEKLNINTSITDRQIITPQNNSGGGFNDHLAYGRISVMTKYLSYYGSFNDIDRLDYGKACDVSIVEAGLKKYLEVSGIEILRYPIRYEILRDIKPQKIVYGGKKGQFFVKRY